MREVTMTAGEYVRLEFVVRDSSGTAVNLTGHAGYTLTFTAKRNRMEDVATITKPKAGGGIVMTSEAGGAGYIELLPTDTSSVSRWTRYQCDLWCALTTNADQVVDTFAIAVGLPVKG